MKKKQVAALVMASVMTLGMTMGQVAFAQSDKKDAESNVAAQSDGVSAQAEDPVVDTSARTVTYNNPIEITLDANSSQHQGFIYAIGNDDKASSSRNYTYIYNAPVHITFDGVTADVGTLTETNYGSGFNAWRFNAPVTVDIKNSNFKNFATQGMFASVSALMGDEKASTVQMNDKLTYNISNSTINSLVG